MNNISMSASRPNGNKIGGADANPMVKTKMTLPDSPEMDGALKASSPVRGNA